MGKTKKQRQKYLAAALKKSAVVQPQTSQEFAIPEPVPSLRSL